MAGPLVASLRLTLVDDLANGLNRLKNMLQGLRDIGRSLTLGKLGEGGAVTALRDITNEARGLTSSLRGIEGAADRAWGAMKRMGTGAAEWGKKTFGPMSNVGAVGAMVSGATLAAPVVQYAAWEDQLRHIAITKGLSGAAADAR